MPHSAQTYYAKNRERILARAKQRYAMRREGDLPPAQSRRSEAEKKAYQKAYREEHRETTREKARARWREMSPAEKEQQLVRARERRVANHGESLLRGAKMRAHRDGLPFALTLFDVKNMLAAGQCECCARFVGVGTHTGKGNRRKGPTADAATLDRVKNSLGYTPDNVALLCWTCNRAKGTSTLEQLEQIVAWLRSRQSQK
jgi:hypothetical protein